MGDWRLTDQEKYLLNVKLKEVSCEDLKLKDNAWHDHCAFRWEAITNKYSKNVYATLDEHWIICKTCYNDFKDKFKWK